MFKFLRRNRKTILRLAFYFPLTVLAAVKSKDYFKRDKLLDTVRFFFFFNLSPIHPHIHTLISFLNRPFLLTSDLLLSLLLPWKVQI